MNTKKLVYLAFGGNIGNVEQTINLAIDLLRNDSNIDLLERSSSWFTEPLQCEEDAQWYTNAVALFETSYKPLELLDISSSIELDFGRKRIEGRQNISRTLDIDILDYSNEHFHNERLILPHPRMFERAFVLVPLLEIAPDYRYNNRSIQSYLSEINYKLLDKNIYQA